MISARADIPLIVDHATPAVENRQRPYARRVRKRRFVALALVLLVVAGWIASPYLTAAAFVLDLSGTMSGLRRVLPVRVRPVTSHDVDVPTRYGPIPARVYQPAGTPDRTVIVFPGVHAGGVDEPRLVAFSRRLASTGVTVLSVPLPELRRYRITPASTDAIEDAVLWLSSDKALSPTGVIGVAAVSFAGGLALVAAGRPSLAGRISSVVSLGGHADLPRTMRYLCTGILPDGSTRAPHDYGVAIILLSAIARLVPPDQAAPLRNAVLAFLDASSLTSSDARAADAMFADAKRQAAALPDPARTWAALVDERNVAVLGSRLLPYVEELGGDPALSPDRSAATRVPVFLLHGLEDNVIPSSETPLLADYLRRQGNPNVSWLLTPLVSHATVKPARAIEAWRLIRFWKGVLVR